ncbi:hypothetical protein M8J76_006957 [Diaphorina citri]|nr:hypothetical protein M8J75_015988 [Diaphorina citri]KAI5733041.1 hypothetical protein M8J76_006957 [Diaphorina citri]KAI5738440.1 hypothetical protein M8J77_007117 [Diaphorina citri]
MEDSISLPVFPVVASVVFAFISYVSTYTLIPQLKDMFLKANLCGIDLNKKTKVKIPEALGVVCGCTFLMNVLIFLPLPFGNYLTTRANFPYKDLIEMLAALLSVCCMLLLGFTDDVLDLRWRHKLIMPSIASLPLLIVYYVNSNSTTIIIPKPVREYLGYSLDLGVLYYVYMGLLAVFLTNTINIYAGVNGLEVGQSLVIGVSIIIFNITEILISKDPNIINNHIFSLYLIIPFVATSYALYQHNKYPAQVFVGDTYCYFAGMTFAVVAILGHFSKTMILFFIPQVFNFVYAIPQLFRIVPCPRHRIPILGKDCLEVSYAEFDLLPSNNQMVLTVMTTLGIAKATRKKCNNLTLINLYLLFSGPLPENKLVNRLLMLQIYCSILAFVIRYPVACIFYDS